MESKTNLIFNAVKLEKGKIDGIQGMLCFLTYIEGGILYHLDQLESYYHYTDKTILNDEVIKELCEKILRAINFIYLSNNYQKPFDKTFMDKYIGRLDREAVNKEFEDENSKEYKFAINESNISIISEYIKNKINLAKRYDDPVTGTITLTNRYFWAANDSSNHSHNRIIDYTAPYYDSSITPCDKYIAYVKEKDTDYNLINMMVTFSPNKDYRIQSHMYIWRWVTTDLIYLLTKRPPVKNIALSLHSFMGWYSDQIARKIYNTRLERIISWPLDKMSDIFKTVKSGVNLVEFCIGSVHDDEFMNKFSDELKKQCGENYKEQNEQLKQYLIMVKEKYGEDYKSKYDNSSTYCWNSYGPVTTIIEINENSEFLTLWKSIGQLADHSKEQLLSRGINQQGGSNYYKKYLKYKSKYLNLK
ncbi:hypothetical protein Klosneuvirus_4_115 [Klosneuvirus KNV1]|uniref:Uncharacterized protein n=1 Tax=Klosneuvirus KNV1 TaxID=1977640 RepID=A0A1V0SKP4_9VIRU|nr:hypothetical protein Klosneuvirus_4_115 [Klosneuvirus KNV1]